MRMRRWSPDCPFCLIVRGLGPADVRASWRNAIALVPLFPVVPGHLIVIPRVHVPAASDQPRVTGAVFRRAAELGGRLYRGRFNLTMSEGPDATQTVPHVHAHIVPRERGDMVSLPWDVRG